MEIPQLSLGVQQGAAKRGRGPHGRRAEAWRPRDQDDARKTVTEWMCWSVMSGVEMDSMRWPFFRFCICCAVKRTTWLWRACPAMSYDLGCCEFRSAAKS